MSRRAHAHDHCEHPRLKYCKECRVVHCLDCKVEWGQNRPSPYWPSYVQSSSTFSPPSLAQAAGASIDLTPQISCSLTNQMGPPETEFGRAIPTNCSHAS